MNELAYGLPIYPDPQTEGWDVLPTATAYRHQFVVEHQDFVDVGFVGSISITALQLFVVASDKTAIFQLRNFKVFMTTLAVAKTPDEGPFAYRLSPPPAAIVSTNIVFSNDTLAVRAGSWVTLKLLKSVPLDSSNPTASLLVEISESSVGGPNITLGGWLGYRSAPSLRGWSWDGMSSRKWPFSDAAHMAYDTQREQRIPRMRLCSGTGAISCGGFPSLVFKSPQFAAGATPAGLAVTAVAFSAALNGQNYVLLGQPLAIFNNPTIGFVSSTPTSGPVEGGTTILLTASAVQTLVGSVQVVRFLQTTDSGGVVARFSSCRADVESGMLTCVTPPMAVNQAILSLSLNGMHWADTLNPAFLYYQDPVLVSVCLYDSKTACGCREAPANNGLDAFGGDLIMVGVRFLDALSGQCRFGSNRASSPCNGDATCLQDAGDLFGQDMLPYYFEGATTSDASHAAIAGGVATVMPGTALVNCTSDGSVLYMTCAAPPRPPGAWSVYVTQNSVDFHPSEREMYYGAPPPETVPEQVLNYLNCSAGYYSLQFDRACKPCGKGTYSAVEGSKACTPCVAGKYADTLASVACTACPTLFTTVTQVDLGPWPYPIKFDERNGAQSQEECMCNLGTYVPNQQAYISGTGAFIAHDQVNTVGESCIQQTNGQYQRGLYTCCLPCPAAGAICPGGNATLYNAAGYWQQPGVIGVFQKCTPPESCLECDSRCVAMKSSCLVAQQQDSTLFCSLECQCDPQNCYTGPICGNCARSVMVDGTVASYYRSGSLCLRCPPTDPYQLAATLIAVVLLLYVFAQMAQHLKGLGSPRILMGFLAVSMQFRDLNVHWPPEIKDFFHSLQFFYINIDWIKPECALVITYPVKWGYTMCIPIFVAGCIFLFYWLAVFAEWHAYRLFKCRLSALVRILLCATKYDATGVGSIEKGKLVKPLHVVRGIGIYVVKLPFKILVGLLIMTIWPVVFVLWRALEVLQVLGDFIGAVAFFVIQECRTNRYTLSSSIASVAVPSRGLFQMNSGTLCVAPPSRFSAAWHEWATSTDKKRSREGFQMFDHAMFKHVLAHFTYAPVTDGFEHLKNMLNMIARSSEMERKKAMVDDSGGDPARDSSAADRIAASLEKPRSIVSAPRVISVARAQRLLEISSLASGDEVFCKPCKSCKERWEKARMSKTEESVELKPRMPHAVKGDAMCLACADPDQPCAMCVRLQRDARKYTFYNAFYMFLTFTHIQLTARVIEVFICTKQPDGSELLDADVSTVCWQNKHLVLVALASVLLVVYCLGIPMYFLIQLRRVFNKKKQHEPDVKAQYGYMYLKYKPERYYWEVLVMLRKAGVVVLRMWTTGANAHMIQIVGTLMWLLSFLAFHSFKRPFIEGVLNDTESVNLLDNVLLLAAAMMYLTDRMTNNTDPSQESAASRSLKFNSGTFAYIVIAIVGVALLRITWVVVVEVAETLPFVHISEIRRSVRGYGSYMRGRIRLVWAYTKVVLCCWRRGYRVTLKEEEDVEVQELETTPSVLMQIWAVTRRLNLMYPGLANSSIVIVLRRDPPTLVAWIARAVGYVVCGDEGNESTVNERLRTAALEHEKRKRERAQAAARAAACKAREKAKAKAAAEKKEKERAAALAGEDAPGEPDAKEAKAHPAADAAATDAGGDIPDELPPDACGDAAVKFIDWVGDMGQSAYTWMTNLLFKYGPWELEFVSASKNFVVVLLPGAELPKSLVPLGKTGVDAEAAAIPCRLEGERRKFMLSAFTSLALGRELGGLREYADAAERERVAKEKALVAEEARAAEQNAEKDEQEREKERAAKDSAAERVAGRRGCCGARPAKATASGAVLEPVGDAGAAAGGGDVDVVDAPRGTATTGDGSGLGGARVTQQDGPRLANARSSGEVVTTKSLGKLAARALADEAISQLWAFRKHLPNYVNTYMNVRSADFCRKIDNNPLLSKKGKDTTLLWLNDRNTTFREKSLFLRNTTDIYVSVIADFMDLKREHEASEAESHRLQKMMVLRRVAIAVLVFVEAAVVYPMLFFVSKVSSPATVRARTRALAAWVHGLFGRVLASFDDSGVQHVAISVKEDVNVMDPAVRPGSVAIVDVTKPASPTQRRIEDIVGGKIRTRLAAWEAFLTRIAGRFEEGGEGPDEAIADCLGAVLAFLRNPDNSEARVLFGNQVEHHRVLRLLLGVPTLDSMARGMHQGGKARLRPVARKRRGVGRSRRDAKELVPRPKATMMAVYTSEALDSDAFPDLRSEARLARRGLIPDTPDSKVDPAVAVAVVSAAVPSMGVVELGGRRVGARVESFRDSKGGKMSYFARVRMMANKFKGKPAAAPGSPASASEGLPSTFERVNPMLRSASAGGHVVDAGSVPVSPAVRDDTAFTMQNRMYRASTSPNGGGTSAPYKGSGPTAALPGDAAAGGTLGPASAVSEHVAAAAPFVRSGSFTRSPSGSARAGLVRVASSGALRGANAPLGDRLAAAALVRSAEEPASQRRTALSAELAELASGGAAVMPLSPAALGHGLSAKRSDNGSVAAVSGARKHPALQRMASMKAARGSLALGSDQDDAAGGGNESSATAHAVSTVPPAVALLSSADVATGGRAVDVQLGGAAAAAVAAQTASATPDATSGASRGKHPALARMASMKTARGRITGDADLPAAAAPVSTSAQSSRVGAPRLPGLTSLGARLATLAPGALLGAGGAAGTFAPGSASAARVATGAIATVAPGAEASGPMFGRGTARPDVVPAVAGAPRGEPGAFSLSVAGGPAVATSVAAPGRLGDAVAVSGVHLDDVLDDLDAPDAEKGMKFKGKKKRAPAAGAVASGAPAPLPAGATLFGGARVDGGLAPLLGSLHGSRVGGGAAAGADSSVRAPATAIAPVMAQTELGVSAAVSGDVAAAPASGAAAAVSVASVVGTVPAPIAPVNVGLVEQPAVSATSVPVLDDAIDDIGGDDEGTKFKGKKKKRGKK